MTQDAYGTTISAVFHQTTVHAQTVIDTAITVWMQMGLTEDQILYGIAMMNAESGFNPVVSNGAHNTSSIRGLGQFNTKTWNATALDFDAQYGLQPASPLPYIQNNSFDPQLSQGTNAQAGESNDAAAGVYDPDGLVPQLEVVGEGILQEWQAATSSKDVGWAQKLAALGDSDASLLVANSSTNSQLLLTAALAYLNHHNGSAWGSKTLTADGITHLQDTANTLNDASTGAAAALAQVVQGVQDELNYLNTQVANPTGTASDLLIGDPWQLAGATPTLSDPNAPIVISHDIPSIFPTIDNFYSQTSGGLTTYLVSRVTDGDNAQQVDEVSYSYYTGGTAPLDVQNGAASYNFATDSGTGGETFVNGQSLHYTFSNTPSDYQLQSTQTSFLGVVTATESETAVILAGREDISQVFGNGTQITGGQLAYITVATQSESEGIYDGQGRLITGIFETSSLPAITVTISTSDPNYAEEAATLAQEFNVPETDANVVNASTPSQAPDSTTSVDNQGNATTDSTNSATAGTASADPGFQAEVVQANGNTLRWSFNVDGTIASRDIIDTSGNSTSEDFDSNGNYIGTSTSTANPDGSVVTQTYDAQGNSTGSRTTVEYGAGTTLTINGVTTSYSNGCTVTSQYGPAGGGGQMLEFTVSSEVENVDGTYTTTEVNYQPIFNSEGAVTADQLLGTTITEVNGSESVSTDYDANGNVLGSRDMVTTSDGTTTVERLGPTGTLLGSSTLSVDNQGDIILQSFDPTGTLTGGQDLSPGGVLTDTQYQSGSVSGVATSTVTADGGNLTTYTNSSGTVTGDQWVLSNGIYGSDTVQAGGSIAGTSHYVDSTSSSSLNDGSGHITTTNYNAAGAVTGTTTTTVQGGTITSQFVSADDSVSTSATVHTDGSMAATVAPASGGTVGVSLDTSGDVSWTNGTVNGTTTADVVDSNGDLTGTSVTSVATDGSVTVTDFDPTGAETGYSQTVTSDGVTTTTQYTDSSGVFTESGYTQTVVNTDGSVTTTDYTIASGVTTETGYSDTVTNSNGSATTTSYELNSLGVLVESGIEVVSSDDQGHVTTADYGSGGQLTGYTLERTDSSGDVLITQYDSTGTELSSTTLEASGVVSDVVFDSSNGTVTTTWQTNGSYQQTTDDGEGDVTAVNYAANGDAESDTWTQGNGSSGQDTVNADGSVSSISNDGQGNLTTTTTSASGAVTSVTDYYNHGPLTPVPDTDEASWGLRGSMDVDTSADGLTTTTSNYSASGELLGSQSVVVSDGGSTVTTSNFDGSGNRLNFSTVATSADGLTVTTTNYDGTGDTLGSSVVTTSSDGDTVSTATYDGSGNLLGTTSDVTSADGLTTTVSDYDASGNLLDYQTQVTSSDGLTLTTSDYNGSGQLQGSTVAVTSTDGLTVTTSSYDGSQDLLGISVAVTSSDGSTTTTTSYNADNVMTGETVVAQVSENGTVTSAYDASGNLLSEQIAFTGGVEPGNLAISAANINGVPSLVLNGPTDSVTVTGGLVGSVAAVTSLTFDVGATLSLVQLVQQAATLGNAEGTTLAGTFGNWIFDPASGDSLTGGAGLDTLSAWGSDQTVTAGSGGSLIYAQGSDDVITGDTGNDTLDAFGSGTTLVGGLGNETFEVNDPTEVVQAEAGAASNSIFSTVNYTLPTDVDTLTLQGSADLTAAGNSDAANLITGNDGNDVLIAGTRSDTLVSGSGVDTLIGSYGTDTFVINNSADDLYLPYYGYGDVVESSVNYTLTQDVGSLTLIGSSDLEATDDNGYAQITGNAGNDTLVGGSGDDTLIAGAGVDTLVTGTGLNTLIVNNSGDVIDVSPDAGSDTVESSVNFTLSAQLDNLILTGDGNLIGEGNDDASDSITGNAGNDTLIAGTGDDTLVAGSGMDTLVAGTGDDWLQGENASATYVLNSGFGNALISLSSNSNTIQFGTGISAADLSVSMVVDAQGNFALQITDGSSVLTLDDGQSGITSEFDLPGTPQLNFEFADGTELNFSQFLAECQVVDSTLTGANGNLILNADNGASLAGGSGNDTLIGLGTDDTIIAGSGGQVIYGYGNGDLLAGGTGDDTLYGGSNATLAAGSGDSLLNGGSGSNVFALTEGGIATIYLSNDASGLQTLLLPEGMTAADFTSFVAPDGDLVLQSTSGDTTAIIKGYESNGSSSVWYLADQSGNGQFLSDWVATAPEGSGGGAGGSGSSTYAQETQALLQDYQVNLASTLQQIGEAGDSLDYPYPPSATTLNNADDPYNQYYFTGVTANNVTVQGGTLTVGSSMSDQTQSTTTQTGTATYTYSEPVYATVTTPEYITVLSTYDPSVAQAETAGLNVQTVVSADGEPTGYEVEVGSKTVTEQVGAQTVSETVPVESTYTTSTVGYGYYNITGDGGSDVITATYPFVGTVVTGDGNGVDVDLGSSGDPGYGYYGGVTFQPGDVIPPGAFIDVGNGVNDTISGTGHADVIAAGLGLDYIFADLGSTVYVPLEGASTDLVDIGDPPDYGAGPFPHNTLVLPEGITPQDLQFKVYQTDAYGQADGYGSTSTEVLQLTYGESTVLVIFNAGPPSGYLQNASSDDTAGINYFQFSDGTVLTRTQVLAMAGGVITSDDNGTTVTQLAQNVVEGTPVSASNLFSAGSDANGDVRFYQVSNAASSGAFFTLNGTAYSPGQTFDVAGDDLSQLEYVPGAAGSTDTLSVSAFDGIILGSPTTFVLTAAAPSSSNGRYEATQADQDVYGGSTSSTLTGGYGGDTLSGASGQDTFVYNSGSGAETISETAPTTSSSANILQFGAAITPESLTLTIAAGGALVATLGSSGDSVTIDSFNPTDPLNSIPIQQFQFADGTTLSLAQLLSQAQPSGAVGSVANADGTTTYYEVNMPGDPVYTAETESALGDLQDFTLNADGSSEADSFVYNVDGSVTQTEVATPAGGGAATTYVTDYNAQGQETSVSSTSPDGSMEQVTYDSQGRVATDDVTAADGSTQDATNSYNADGSYTETQVETPAGGGAASTFIIDYSAQSQELSSSTTYPDGSTEQVTYDSQGRPVTDDVASADGSAQDVTNSYNADGSYVQTTVTTPVGGAATTAVTDYDSNGNQLSENVYTPSSDGSYTDTWQNQDGSYGGYWWNASTQQYQETWQDSNGANWTDDYQYAAGSSPGSTGVSFTETYTDSAGDQGTRQYNAATGVTSLTWDSSATGMLTGTTTDSGFIGLQNNGELTNTQQDPSFFNPTVSPAFQSFLAGH